MKRELASYCLFTIMSKCFIYITLLSFLAGTAQYSHGKDICKNVTEIPMAECKALNNLSGPVPDLSALKKLKNLKLDNNHLCLDPAVNYGKWKMKLGKFPLCNAIALQGNTAEKQDIKNSPGERIWQEKISHDRKLQSDSRKKMLPPGSAEVRL